MKIIDSQGREAALKGAVIIDPANTLLELQGGNPPATRWSCSNAGYVQMYGALAFPDGTAAAPPILANDAGIFFPGTNAGEIAIAHLGSESVRFGHPADAGWLVHGLSGRSRALDRGRWRAYRWTLDRSDRSHRVLLVQCHCS
jgi:hypothetical protein